MKIVSATFLLILMAASPAFSQSKQDDKAAGDSSDRKEVSGFGGHLIVVENPREFIQEWLKPETPKIKSATVLKRGDSIGAFFYLRVARPMLKAGVIRWSITLFINPMAVFLLNGKNSLCGRNKLRRHQIFSWVGRSSLFVWEKSIPMVSIK